MGLLDSVVFVGCLRRWSELGDNGDPPAAAEDGGADAAGQWDQQSEAL